MDPGVGRFTRMDEWAGDISNPVTHNGYIYGNANPVSFIDPSGHMSLLEVTSVQGLLDDLRGVAAHGGNQVAVRNTLTAVIKHVGPNVSRKLIKMEIKGCVKKKKNGCRIRIPMLLVGGDNPKAAEHIADAQIGGPTASNLVPAGFYHHYEDRSGNRGWARRMPECQRETPAVGMDCDEFPFYKSALGGSRKYHLPVSLALIPSSENRRVGGAYGGLVSGSNLKRGKYKDYVVIAINEFYLPTMPINRKR